MAQAEQKKDWWSVTFDHPGITIQLESRLYMTKEGFGRTPAIYPVTIVQSRYGGTYEGAQWLAFPCSPDELGKEPWASYDDSDVECAAFWEDARKQGWPIGGGNIPQTAYYDLLGRVAVKAGVDVRELAEDPSWPAPGTGSSDDPQL